LCRPAKLGGSSANGLDTFLRVSVNLCGSKVKQSLAHGTRQYDSFVTASHSDCSFAAYHRKIHTIYGIRFSDGIVSFGLQTRLFERAPEEVLLARAEEQIVDFPRLVESFAVGQNERDSAQSAAGDGVGKLDQLAQLQLIVTLLSARMVRLVGQKVPPRDQLVTAYLGIPSDAERILAKGLC
jgi:hypothetical protein